MELGAALGVLTQARSQRERERRCGVGLGTEITLCRTGTGGMTRYLGYFDLP